MQLKFFAMGRDFFLAVYSYASNHKVGTLLLTTFPLIKNGIYGPGIQFANRYYDLLLTLINTKKQFLSKIESYLKIHSAILSSPIPHTTHDVCYKTCMQ